MIMSDQLVDERNFYYSSDEDVAWGPLTLREIRREFSIPMKQTLFLKTAAPLDCDKYQDLQTSGSIISSNTDYCTANETVESNIKSDQINDESKSNKSSLNSKEIVSFSENLSSPNQISEEKECLDTDAIICINSDESNEDIEHCRVKTEVSNFSNIDVISLSSDDEQDYSNGKFYEIDVGIGNVSEENNKVPDENISVNRKIGSSISSNRTSDSDFERNSSINQYTTDKSVKKHSLEYRISRNSRYSLNKNKNIEQRNQPVNDSSRNQYVEYRKSQSYISSLNENTESTEFDAYEIAMNANSAGNIKRNQWDEAKSSTFSEDKSYLLDHSGNIKHSSFKQDRSSHECEMDKNKSIEGFITSDSMKGISLEPENFTNFEVTKTEIDYKNHVYKCNNDKFSSELENCRVLSNVLSGGFGDEHKYRLTSSDDFPHLNPEFESRSELNYGEDIYSQDDTLSEIDNLTKSGLEINEVDIYSLDDTLSEINNLIKSGLEINEVATDATNRTNFKYPVEENRSLSDIEEPISRIPIFLSVSNQNKNTNMSSVADFKRPNPKNAKQCSNINKKLTPLKKSPNVFQNIISPVRMYIKNSLTPVLKQTHRPIMAEHTSTLIYPETSTSQPIKHRNLVKSFPEVIYKPSKKVIEKYDNEIILPVNIRKLVKERIVIRHEIRTKLDLNKSELTTSEKLQRADISNVISDERNMSLRTAKQGFNI